MMVMGTRPEVMKLGPVARELRRYPKQFRVTLVGTGQHREMVPQYLGVFRLRLDHDLRVMKERQTLADITSRTMRRMDTLLAQERPDVVVVQGDTTAVLVGALAAFYRQVPVAHVEEGLLAGERDDPYTEELTRGRVGGLSTMHLAPTARARESLLRENVAAESIYVTGNTAVDALLLAAKRRPRRGVVPAGWLTGKRLILVTAHRRENWDRGIEEICLALGDLAERFPDVVIVYAVHPNPVVRETAERVLAGRERVHLIAPPGYAEFVDLMKRSYLILTDSGGIQEEAPSLNRPVLVMRRTTERQEGAEAGCLELVGPDRKRIVERASALLRDRAAYEAMASRANPFGDGKASARIRRALAYHFGMSRRRPEGFAAG